MIRINLLPFRAARKKENIKRQITIYGLSLALLLMVMVYYFLRLSNELSAVEAKQKSLRADLRTYQKTVRRIDELDKKIKDMRSKLAVIKKLESNKKGPVHLLDEIAMAVPKDKLWLNSLQEKKGSLTLQGTAMDNETVALFMTNLEKSKYMKSVDLKSAKRRTVPKYKIAVSDFVLNCRTYAYELATKKPEPTKKRGKKRRR